MVEVDGRVLKPNSFWVPSRSVYAGSKGIHDSGHFMIDSMVSKGFTFHRTARISIVKIGSQTDPKRVFPKSREMCHN